MATDTNKDGLQDQPNAAFIGNADNHLHVLNSGSEEEAVAEDHPNNSFDLQGVLSSLNENALQDSDTDTDGASLYDPEESASNSSHTTSDDSTATFDYEQDYSARESADDSSEGLERDVLFYDTDDSQTNIQTIVEGQAFIVGDMLNTTNPSSAQPIDGPQVSNFPSNFPWETIGVAGTFLDPGAAGELFNCFKPGLSLFLRRRYFFQNFNILHRVFIHPIPRIRLAFVDANRDCVHQLYEDSNVLSPMQRWTLDVALRPIGERLLRIFNRGERSHSVFRHPRLEFAASRSSINDCADLNWSNFDRVDGYRVLNINSTVRWNGLNIPILTFAVLQCYTREKDIELILSHPRINVNFPDSEGRTVLHWALWQHSVGTPPDLSLEGKVRLLLSHPGIDINARCNKGNTPLQAASRMRCNSRRNRGFARSIQRLIEAGAAADQEEDVSNGNTFQYYYAPRPIQCPSPTEPIDFQAIHHAQQAAGFQQLLESLVQGNDENDNIEGIEH